VIIHKNLDDFFFLLKLLARIEITPAFFLQFIGLSILKKFEFVIIGICFKLIMLYEIVVAML
jgi:hypothetical protein